DDCAGDPVLNTSAAPASSCAFHAAICVVCTSCNCASSASVFSPLIAANATFALKPGLWFRRDRLDMFPPATRHQRRFQAGKPLIGLFRFAQPPLSDRERVYRSGTLTTLIGAGERPRLAPERDAAPGAFGGVEH